MRVNRRLLKNIFRLWNMNNFEAISKMSVDQKIRSCAFDADGSHIALGLTDGSFMVLKTRYVFACGLLYFLT